MKYEVLSERSGEPLRVTGPGDLFPVLARYTRRKQEVFLLVTLDGGKQVIKVHIVTVGLINRTLIHPREIFVRAIRDYSCSIIIAHTHPSGVLDPSREDIDATKRIYDCGKLLGIEVLDHLIVAKTRFVSFKELGLIFP